MQIDLDLSRLSMSVVTDEHHRCEEVNWVITYISVDGILRDSLPTATRNIWNKPTFYFYAELCSCETTSLVCVNYVNYIILL